LKKADLWIKNVTLADVRHVIIIDVTLRHEFHGSVEDLNRNGEPSHPDVDGALAAAVKEKLDAVSARGTQPCLLGPPGSASKWPRPPAERKAIMKPAIRFRARSGRACDLVQVREPLLS